jgi:hypothetical protein
MIGKQRLSASVDAELMAEIAAAAARGEARTVSAWVNDALRLKLEHDRRLRALAEFIAADEDVHGPITEDEIARVRRELRRPVRTKRRPSRGRRA